MKKILVTGGTGFIGTHLVRSLANDGFEVSVVSRYAENPFEQLLNVKMYTEITNAYRLEQVFQQDNFDVIIHLATFYLHTPVLTEIEEMLESNVQFGTFLLELATKYGCSKFINSCSNAEFDSEGFTSPNSLYAATKSSFRSLCDFYDDKKNMKVIHLVLYDNYGEKDRRGKIINGLISKLGTGVPIDMSPGEQVIYPVYINDTVNAFCCALRNFDSISSLGNNKFCVAPKLGVNLKQLVRLIEEISQQHLSVNWGGLPYRKNEIMTPWVGERLPNWTESIDLNIGLEKIITTKLC